MFDEFNYKESNKIGSIKHIKSSPKHTLVSQDEFKRIGQKYRISHIYSKSPDLIPNLGKLVLFKYNG